MLKLERLAGTVLWSVLVCAKWFQAQFTHPIAEWWLDTVLANWEESIKSLIRELYAQVIRIANHLLNAVFSWFPGYQSVRTRHQKPSAWQAWWEENRQGTFNALIARDRTDKAGTNGVQQQAKSAASFRTAQQAPQPEPTRLAPWWIFGRGKSENATGAVADSSQKKRKMNKREKPSSSNNKKIPANKKLKHRSSELFERPAGWAVQEKSKRGFLEDGRIALELATTAVFDAVRWLVRKVLLMPEKQVHTSMAKDRRSQPWTAGNEDDMDDSSPERPGRSHPGPRLRPTNSFNDIDSLPHTWTAGKVIRAAGYPHEEHTVTTDDGYRLKMERLSRRGGKDVVFFMHGILDTSMGWVSNGVTGSQAFAAFDQGFDVWLGNSRANPPRDHERKEMMGSEYWYFTVNELGKQDVAAQLDYIDKIKRRELETNVRQRFEADANPEGLSSGLHNARQSRKRSHRHSFRIRKSSSENAVNALEGRSTFSAANSERPQSPQRAPPPTHAEANGHQTRENGDQVHQQPAAAPEPRRRYGMLGMKRNKSELPRRPSSARHLHGLFSQPPPSQASDETDDEAFASPRADLEPVSPEVSPFRQAASQDWQGSGPRQQMTAGGADEQSAHIVPIAEASAAEQQAAASENGHAHDGQPEFAGSRTSSADAWTGNRQPSGAEHGVEAGQAEANGHGRPAQQAASQGNFVAAERLRANGPDARVPDANGPEANEPEASGRSRQTGSASGLEEPYRLRAVGHSLGGASLLIYAVTRSMRGQPTHLTRLILLTPAGFLKSYPMVAGPFRYILPPLVWALHWLRPGKGTSCYIPSSLLRYFTFKITVDMQQIPALDELVRAGLRLLLNGDSSQWDRALQMPHYNTQSMPAISLHTALHLIQWIKTGRFQLYNYRNAAANREAYGTDQPLDIAANYAALKMPIDILAGTNDGVIAVENVRKHRDELKKAGCRVTYKEFDFGHLDFVFAVKEDLRHYVLSRLALDS